MSRSPRPVPPEDDADSSSLLRRSLLTGLALTIPIVLTLVVLQFALNLVSGIVAPIVAAFEFVVGPDEADELLLEVVTVLTLTVLILLVGFVAEEGWSSGWVAAEFDAFMSRIPGLGSVYSGTRHMSEMLLEQDTESFQEVKLVEFPHEGAFMLGFLTAEPPEAIHAVAEAEDMVTLFVPLAPNPVMGGFLSFFPADRVYDVDLSVEEGVQAILTSGAAVDPRAEEAEAEEEEAAAAG